MRFSYLEEFVALAKRRNFTSAARDLNISQSTLSKHMADLSRTTGLSLLDSSQGARLTSSGTLFLQYAERMLRLRDEALEKCKEIERGYQGRLCVEDPIVLTGMTSELNKLLADFSEANPGIQSLLRVDESLTTLENIDRGVFDIAEGIFLEKNLDHATVDGRDFELIPFMEDEVVLWVGANTPLGSKKDLRFTDLTDVEIYLPGTMAWSKWRNVLRQMAHSFGFELKVSLAILDSINEYWSSSPSDKAYLLTSQITKELRVTSQKDMVVRRFKHDDTSFMFYLMYDAHSKNPAIRTFDDWWLSTQRPVISVR